MLEPFNQIYFDKVEVLKEESKSNEAIDVKMREVVDKANAFYCRAIPDSLKTSPYFRFKVASKRSETNAINMEAMITEESMTSVDTMIVEGFMASEEADQSDMSEIKI
ncbi:hypothetical protein BC939DRAFT_505018 [Gamsiella multidivaricata]|uniref:uncharacterized protein n=1 Tax=Gamsiella multidivaricata TaxID=101098 RepID=UPI002220386D|nr:uncharacterized protein BC939DRAFT_505018 [Gamsiella multidivaricata]KAI7820401.1 hypothetical protein BC939DRAFT_505018 [Gamsiella multidivaricata]